MGEWISVEVCYALPQQQSLIAVRLVAGATVRDAINASAITAYYPEVDLTVQRVGIWGKLCQLDTPLANDDRVEIYRPLSVDPKLARQRRVAKTRQTGTVEGRKWLQKGLR